jgi:hypothetical protein
MKRILFGSSLIMALLAFSMSAVGAIDKTQGETLFNQLSQIQSIAYDTSSGLFSYALEDNKTGFKETQYYLDVKAGITKGNELTTSIDSLVGILQSPGLQPLNETWAGYRDILANEETPLVAAGFVDTYHMQQLAGARTKLVASIDTIRKVIINQLQLAAADPQVLSQEQALKIKEISMTYSGRIAGIMTGIDPKLDISAQAKQVSSKFDMLIAATEGKPQVQTELDAALTEWQFIMPALASSKQTATPVAINMYATSIASKLENIKYE